MRATATNTTSWPRHLRSKRLRLRAIDASDFEDETKLDWLSAAEGEVLGAAHSTSLRARLCAGDAGYWIDLPAAPAAITIGACSVRLAGPTNDGDLVWCWLAIDPYYRARGLAAAAVMLVERAAARAGARRARVRVAAANGIALYFWLRLGYRPLAAPAESLDLRADELGDYPGTWMLRDPI